MSVHENKFLGIIFILVLLLGGVTLISLFDPEEMQIDLASKRATEISTEQLLKSTNDSERTPASIPNESKIIAIPSTSANTKISNIENAIVLNPTCDNQKEYSLSIKGTSLQLEGKNCSTKFKKNSLEIVNLSNGFTASVFDKVNGLYQTDVMQLKKGPNNLLIKFLAADGKQVEKKLIINSEDQ